MEKNKLTTLITQYQTLCRYCDEIFATTLNAFRPYMQCAKGCAACCILETVVPLEAYIIASYLKSSSSPALAVVSHRENQAQDQCIFLHNNECAIYPVRPIICRTHGLPMIYPDRPGIDTCPLNFRELDITTIDQQFLLDVENITMNLMRLNLAFCFITGNPQTAENRIPLSWLVNEEKHVFKDFFIDFLEINRTQRL